MLYSYENLEAKLSKRFGLFVQIIPFSSREGFEITVGGQVVVTDWKDFTQHQELEDYILQEIHKQIPEVLL